MMLTVLLFFAIISGLGFSATYLLIGKFEDNLEKFLMSIGIGLGIFPLLAVTLNLMHIPLHWLTFLILALLGPLAALFKNKFSMPQIKINISKSSIYTLIVIILASVLLFVYLKGAFGYPYFEDDDPWGHSIGTTYIAEHKTFSRYTNEPVTKDNFFRTYMEPYPPAYDTLMGILYQTNDSVMWTLKFFNALLIALGIIFFYLFAAEFSQSRRKAIWATFVITILPCFMSHFIWAQTLGIVLIFPAFYCFEKIKHNWKWAIPGALVTAGIFLSQPSTAAFFAIMFAIYFAAKLFAAHPGKEKLFSKENTLLLISWVGGAILSMIYWIPTLIKYGWMLTLEGVGVATELFEAGTADTSGGIIYGIMDYVIAPLASKMDQPTGIGIFASLLLIFSIIILIANYKKVKTSYYLMTILLWLIFTFIGTEGNALPFKLFPHRFWAFMAIPVAFLAAEGIVTISKSLKNPALKYSVLLVIIFGLLWTSGYPKYYVETSQWPPGATWSSAEELGGYMALQQNLPKGTRIFNTCSHDGKLLAFDMYIPPYDVDLYWFKLQMANKTTEDLYYMAKQRDFEYIVVDGYCARRMTVNQTNELLTSMANSTRFKLTGSNNAFWLFEVM
jgi:hypothetical protein